MILSPLDLLCTPAQKHMKQLYRSIILHKIWRERQNKKNPENQQVSHPDSQSREMAEFTVVKCSEAINRESFSLLEELEVRVKAIYHAHPGMNVLGPACPEPEISGLPPTSQYPRGAEAWVLG